MPKLKIKRNPPPPAGAENANSIAAMLMADKPEYSLPIIDFINSLNSIFLKNLQKP